MPLHVQLRDRVAVLTLDDPDRRNALTRALGDELVAAVDDLSQDPEVGALVVTGAGSAFCSGADVADLRGLSGDDADARVAAGLQSIYAGFLGVLECPLPTVAAVNGPAVGAGMNLALACDLRIAGRSARFDPKFISIGLHPGGGHTRLLERLVGPGSAAAMVLFGQAVAGPDAVARGLAWETTEDDALLDRAVEVASRAAAAPRDLAIAIKATLRTTPGLPDHSAAVAAELAPQVRSLRGLST